MVDYKEYLKSKHWQETRKAALERAWYRCQICNAEDNLHVHHNTYDRIGYEADRDLVVLCKYCHAKFHNIVKEDGRIPDLSYPTPKDGKKWYTDEEFDILISSGEK